MIDKECGHVVETTDIYIYVQSALAKGGVQPLVARATV